MVDGQLASPVTVRVTCYTITNNYMEKKWLTRKPWNPFHRRIKLLYHYKQLHGEKMAYA